VSQANASLKTSYDNDDRPADEQSRANEAQNEARAELASYSPSVPVPQLKEDVAASAVNAPRAVSAPRATAAAARSAPHFMSISAPQMGGNDSGAIMEIGGDEQALASYKAPDEAQAGQVGAALLGGK